MSDFLFEIGLEEVPARMIASAEHELHERTIAMLKRERLLVGEDYGTTSLSTPRRLAVHVWGNALKDRQSDLSEELLGPAVKIAYKDGAPGPAAVAFARKSGVELSDLKIVSTAKGEYISANSVKLGRAAAEVIASELPKELAAIYWAKNMYWRPGKPERFVRPVRWITALLDDRVVPVSFAGYTADRVTYGHRVLFGAAPITLATAIQYRNHLLNAKVMADVEDRRHTIRKALDHVCRTIPGTRWREDHELVDKLTHLTEWPSVIAGSFEPEYLTLPEEVLVTVMRDHQNYFAVEDSSGKLAPHFLAVLNTVATAEGEAVIRHGNERVLRARFNDARFFWDFDQKITLKDRQELLKNVTFQKDVGSYYSKSYVSLGVARNLTRLSNARSVNVNENTVDTATLFAKTDLTTELVKEFTELQGIIGGLYAKFQDLGEEVSLAIYDQYLPESMEDSVPRTREGAIVAIADKASTIACLFGLGLEPTGSKDPFALRRAANGIVKILAETELPLTLRDVAVSSCGAPSSMLIPEQLRDKLSAFFAERLDFYLREVRVQAYDVVKAVLATGSDDPRDALARAEAITAVRGSDDFLAVSAAFKRMKNILTQAADKGYSPAERIGGTLHPAEAELWVAAEEIGQRSAQYAELRDYVPALQLIATLRPLIDRYFEEVMVLDPDPVVRGIRLLILTAITSDIRKIADLSEIVVSS